MTHKLSKKEQLELVAFAIGIEVAWVGEDKQFAQLPEYQWRGWDPFDEVNSRKKLDALREQKVEAHERSLLEKLIKKYGDPENTND